MKTKEIKKEETLIVKGNLLVINYGISQTNHTYFSITGEYYRGAVRAERALDSAGCIHDTILKHAPKFKDLIALHGKDISGIPHLGNLFFFYELGRACWYASDLSDINYDKKKMKKNIDLFREELRVDKDKANEILKAMDKAMNVRRHQYALECINKLSWEQANAEGLQKELKEQRFSDSEVAKRLKEIKETMGTIKKEVEGYTNATRTIFLAFVKELTPIWKQQAKDAIKKYDLR